MKHVLETYRVNKLYFFRQNTFDSESHHQINNCLFFSKNEPRIEVFNIKEVEILNGTSATLMREKS